MPASAVRNSAYYRLKSCLPKNGMTWHHGPHVTRRQRVDTRVVAALQSLGVPIRKREVQIEFTNLVDAATALAQRTSRDLDRDVDRSEFVAELHRQHRLGRHLSLDYFEQTFTAIVLARYRYLADRYDEDLPVENPATHSPLARAVDAFEEAAWFWSTTEAFLEDDHTRADEGGVSEGDSDVGDGGRAADSLAGGAGLSAAGGAGGAGGASASIADANDPAYVSLAAGVDAMELDGGDAGVVGLEMEVDG